jgi:uncharacterized membrane protein
VVKRSPLPYLPLVIIAAFAAFLYEQTSVVLLHQATQPFVWLVAFPAAAVVAGVVTYYSTHRKLFRACLVGVLCALVLALFAALAVGAAGAIP